MSRRGLLTGTLGAALLAAGCGVPAARQDPEACTTEDRSAQEPTLAFSNWPQYLDVDDRDPARRPTLDEFVSRTGIQVTYTEDINDNNEFFGKVRQQLAACRGIDRDLIVVTDWLAARMIQLGWIQQLDPERLPNVRANLLPQLANRPFDPDGRSAVPWQSGLAGLAWNARVTREVRTVEELLTRPDLKGRVTLLSDMRDTMGLLLQSAGHDPANFTEEQFDAALATLERAVGTGQVRRFTGNDYTSELARGDIAACLAWSGDAIQLSAADERIRFVAPEQGTILFSDNLLVPAVATHRANAERLIDHYYDPVVAARLAAHVNYICPVRGAREEMEKIDPALATNPLIFPDEALLGRATVFMTLDEEQDRRYETKFQRVTGA